MIIIQWVKGVYGKMENINLKQFVIIPKKLKMSTGKMASQVAHATFMAIEKQREYLFNKIRKWKREGMCVIVLQCSTSERLMSMAKYLEQWDIIHYLYIDEGITEVEMGTPTALATGVLTEDKFWIFETMRLYK